MKKILIIEDDPITAKIYRTMLQKQGCEVEVAADGQIGFERLMEFRPDGLLLDLMLPKTSGIDLLQKIRELEFFRNLPIVAFTNAFVPHMVDNALKAGATKVFSKSSMIRSMLIDALGLDKQPDAVPPNEAAGRELP
jgi:CheY-like chemotaxis protein